MGPRTISSLSTRNRCSHCGAGTRACRLGTPAEAWRTLHRASQRQPRLATFLILFLLAAGLAAGQSLTIYDVTPSPAISNQPVTFTVLSTSLPDNTVVVFNDAGDRSITCPSPASATAVALCSQLGMATLNGSAAVFTVPGGLSVGRHRINACALTVCSQNVDVSSLLRPTLVLTIAPSGPALLCQPVTLTATITPANATGTVAFYDSGTALIGTAPLSNGSATIQVTPSLGVHSAFFASYTPDPTAYFAGVSSDPVPETINGDAQVTLQSDKATARVGETVTLTATVAGNPQCSSAPPLPAGTVSILDNGTSIQQDNVAPNGQVPPFRISTLAPGTHTLAARYNGDAAGRYAPRTSPAVTVVISAAGGPSPTLTPSGTPQATAAGTAFASPLQVTYRDANGVTQAGVTVTFTAPPTGASALVPATALTDSSGVARVTAIANSIPGSYTVTASANGASVDFSLTNLSTGNFAQGKPATQSSLYPGAPGPQAAVDGSTNGAFYDGSVTATSSEPNPWWQVDLQNSMQIGSVVVWNRTDCCGSRLNDYWVFVSDTPFLPTDTPASLSSRPGTFSSHQTSEPAPSALILLPSQGRYVRIQFSRTDILSLAEVQVFGPAVAVVNAAQGKLATQSSMYVGSPDPSAAVDGNTDGNYYDNSVTATNAEPGAWWQVDLRSSLPITSVTLWNRTDCCANRLGDFWVFVSDTPFDPSDTPATLQFRPGTFASHQTTVPGPSLDIPVNLPGRYVRVQLGNTGNLSLAEVQVFTPAYGGPADLAQGRQAAQSSTYPGSPSAGAAVDGNTDGNYYRNSVTATNQEFFPWWQVDLGSSSNVHSVVVWNRTDCCSSRLNDFWVFVSDTPFGPSDTPGTLQTRPGTFASHQTVAPGPSLTVLVNANGRYVRVQLNRFDFLSLAEVQVF